MFSRSVDNRFQLGSCVRKSCSRYISLKNQTAAFPSFHLLLNHNLKGSLNQFSADQHTQSLWKREFRTHDPGSIEFAMDLKAEYLLV